MVGVTNHGSEKLVAKEGISAIRALSTRCGIPVSLKALNIPESAVPPMAVSAMAVTRLLDNNPRTVTREDAEAVYKAAYNGTLD